MSSFTLCEAYTLDIVWPGRPYLSAQVDTSFQTARPPNPCTAQVLNAVVCIVMDTLRNARGLTLERRTLHLRGQQVLKTLGREGQLGVSVEFAG